MCFNSIPQWMKIITTILFNIQFLSFASCEGERRGLVVTAVCASPSNFQLQLPWSSYQFGLGSSGRTTTDCSPCSGAECDSGAVCDSGARGFRIVPRRSLRSPWCLITERRSAPMAAATNRWTTHKESLLSPLTLIFFFQSALELYIFMQVQWFLNIALAVMCKCRARESVEEGSNGSDWLN